MIVSALILTGGCAQEKNPAGDPNRIPAPTTDWRAVHLFAPWHDEVPMFERTITELLVPLGVNTIVLEVDYQFAFDTHPELREPGNSLTKSDARELAALCRAHNIRLIPLFNCLGHQSLGNITSPLLLRYPELDETPDAPKDNSAIYARSWCPSNPATNQIVFPLLGEIIDAFEPEAFHVGMDEVLLIASDQCPRCKGKDPAQLFARQVNDLRHYLVVERKLAMLMWGDRLIDRKQMNYGDNLECSSNGTARAIELISNDIIICDWHYRARSHYPSLRYFQGRGFRTIACVWKDLKAARAYVNYAQRTRPDKMLGIMFTSWVGADEICPALLHEPAGAKLSDEALAEAATLEAGMKDLTQTLLK